MAFPTVPTAANGRILAQFQANTTAARTFPDLSGLTKNAGDLLIAIVVAYQRSAAGATFSGWTGGFTELADVDGGTSTTMAVGIATKTSTGSETGTFAVTQAATVTGHVDLFVMSIEGWHGTSLPEVTALAVGTTAVADPAALSPSWGADDTLWIAVGGVGETSLTGAFTGIGGGNTPPTNYSNSIGTGESGDVIGAVGAAVAFQQVNAASENVGPWGGVDTSNARNAAMGIAVRPSAGVSGTATPAAIAANMTVQPAVATGIRIQSAGKIATGVNNTTLAFPNNVTAGNLLVVSHAHWVGAASSVSTPTDTQSNIYLPVAAQQSSTNARLRSFYTIAGSTGACTVTFDIGGTADNGDITCTVTEFVGLDATPLDQTNIGAATGTAVSSGDITPSDNGELLYAAVSHDGTASNSLTEEAGWDLIYEATPAAGMPISVVYKVQPTAATEDADWTVGASVPWIAHVGSFKLPAAGGATATPGAIAANFGVQAATTQAGGTASPSAVAATMTAGAVTIQAGGAPTPAAIDATFTIIDSNTREDPVASGLYILHGATEDPVGSGLYIVSGMGGEDPTGSGLYRYDGIASGGSVATPAAVNATFTVQPATASGGGAATATPGVITANYVPQAPTTQAGSRSTPAAVNAALVLQAVTTRAGATAAPAALPANITVQAAAATGGGSTTATPTAINASFTMPAPTTQAGSTVAPAVVNATFTLPIAIGQASKTATPAVIPVTTTVQPVTATGGGSATATPNAIAVVHTFPAPGLVYGSIVSPATIAWAITVVAAIASGTPPDLAPVTVTLRGATGTVTVRYARNTTIMEA